MLSLLAVLALSTIVENQKPGTAGWEITNPALAREIEGYASKTSVNGGDAIDLYVSTVASRYAIDVFRMGWYGGAGARQVAGPVERDGILQPTPSPDPTTGLVECAWRDPYRLTTSDADGAWATGVYLARLTTIATAPRGSTRSTAPGPQTFIVFVVRDDSRDAPIVFQSSVTTFAAYNNWGGKSLYGFNSGNLPARKVSFDRPYATNPYGVRLDGASDFLRRWEYNAVRFLEREGYDVEYTTDVDTHEHPVPPGTRIYLSVGHDEYWSWQMRDHVEAARDRGVHLAFLGANVCYWQIRFETDARGDPDRTIVAYKEAASDLDPLATDGRPQNNRQITGRWREPPTSRPEERLVGVMYAADPVDGDIVVTDVDHWAFEGTGLHAGDRLAGLLGYEVDAIYGGGPRGRQRLAHSPFIDQGANGRTRYADMTIYTAASGALVFATGSMQWNWGLDGYNAPEWHPARTSASAQRITHTILNRMLETRAAPIATSARSAWLPSPIVAIAMLTAAVFVLRAWLRRPAARSGR
jgi:hypothetical protein